MAINCTEAGESVYTRRPIEERSQDPIFQWARTMAARYSQTRNILDIGCSDGVATFGMQDISVIGVDLSTAALEQARTADPSYNAICSDATQLPFSPRTIEYGNRSLENAGIDTVLLLDIIEHMPRQDAVDLLRFLGSSLPVEHTLVISMPIISNLSAFTWQERLEILKNRQRPENGLYDRTHEILTNHRGHVKLFETAGYSIIEQYQTNHMAGVTGKWDWLADYGDLSPALQRELPRQPKIVQFVLHALSKSYKVAHETDSRLLQKATEALVAYQGLYVLKPAEQNT